MLLLLPTWLVLFSLCLALGAGVYGAVFRVGGRALRTAPELFQIFWIGFGFLLVILEIGSMFHAVDRHMLAVVCGTALIGIPAVWRLRKYWWRFSKKLGLGVTVVRLTAGGILSLAVAYNATLGTDWYDTLSTHLQQVLWNREYGVVPGVGALNPKLGFDQAHHLLAALTDIGIWRDKSVHVALSFMIVALMVQWIWILTGPARSEEARRAKLFAALTLPYLAGKAMTREVSSLSGDLAMAILLLAGFQELIRLRLSRCSGQTSFRILVVATLGACIFSVKFSGAPFVAVVLVMTAWWTVCKMSPKRLRSAFTIWLMPMLLIIGTVVRRVILTGWPLFPIPFFRIPLRWALSYDITLDEYMWIKSWARVPHVDRHEVLDHGFFHWFISWFGVFRGSREYVLLTAGVVAALWWFGSTIMRTRMSCRRSFEVGLLIAVLCLVCWFVGAPDLRFGGVFFWIFAALTLIPVFCSIGIPNSSGVLMSIAILLVYWNQGFSFLLPVKPDWFGVTPAPVFKTHKVTISGPDKSTFDVKVPDSGDLCGNVMPPCTTYLHNQKLRRPRCLGCGFLP